MSDYLVKDLSFEAHHRMEVLLLPPRRGIGGDWRALADKMGYSYEQIRYFEAIPVIQGRGPVFELISDFESRGKTVSELLSLLNEINRPDVIEDLQKRIEEKKQQETSVQSEQLQTHADEDKKGIKTLCEYYDVFICYAGPDKPFADELLRTLEGKPYCMKVCIDYRDFLAGADRLETAAKAIEERCRKVLVILSENFNRCEEADFQAKVALGLSPGAKKRILIPILYKPCDIPTILRFIYYVDYTTDYTRRFFWTKLLASLGFKNCST